MIEPPLCFLTLVLKLWQLDLYRSTLSAVYVWDENKRKANLAKHGLDFADAALVYENPAKLTVISTRKGEQRYADSALINLAGTCLTLVYVERGSATRVIPLRPSSRRERQSLARAGKPN